MNQTIDIHDWLDELDAVLDGVRTGDTYVITRDGQAVASLGPRHGIEP